jgi:uncharacterized protein YecE (DUF72 family)
LTKAAFVTPMGPINIGTAGWSIPRTCADTFPKEGLALERYSTVFPVAEINSSFHRSHRQSTWERWRDSVPEDFRFSAKLPKLITHQLKLVDCTDALDTFLGEVRLLGRKLAVLLVQLPPKLEFDPGVAERFFADLKSRTAVAIACEPRHPSWFVPAADDLLAHRDVARVAADPAICEQAATTGGWRGLSYWRLHGSPVIYRSSYGDRIVDYAAALQAEAGRACDVWCIFDNTASGEGAGDALALTDALHRLR